MPRHSDSSVAVTAELRSLLKQEVARRQLLRWEQDRQLRIAWRLGCAKCGCPTDEFQVDCSSCQERRRSRGRRANSPGLPEGDPRHGTMNAYNNHRCRCLLCREAARLKDRHRKRRSRACQ